MIEGEICLSFTVFVERNQNQFFTILDSQAMDLSIPVAGLLNAVVQSHFSDDTVLFACPVEARANTEAAFLVGPGVEVAFAVEEFEVSFDNRECFDKQFERVSLHLVPCLQVGFAAPLGRLDKHVCGLGDGRRFLVSHKEEVGKAAGHILAELWVSQVIPHGGHLILLSAGALVMAFLKLLHVCPLNRKQLASHFPSLRDLVFELIPERFNGGRHEVAGGEDVGDDLLSIYVFVNTLTNLISGADDFAVDSGNQLRFEFGVLLLSFD